MNYFQKILLLEWDFVLNFFYFLDQKLSLRVGRNLGQTLDMSGLSALLKILLYSLFNYY